MPTVLAPDVRRAGAATVGQGRAEDARPPLRGVRRQVAGAAAVGGMTAALAATTWLVLAAAQRPSVLAPPTLRAAHRWLLGPLSGLLPHLSADPQRLHRDYTIALVVMFAGWVVAWATAAALPVAVVAGAVALAPLVLLLGPPQPLTDMFNYIVYGRMATDGLNPYTTVPAAGPHDAAYMLSNWHHLPSPYGPLFTLLFEPLSRLPLPVAFWTWKVLAVGSALGVLALVWWMARRLERSPQRALVAVGLCPVTVAMGVGAFHNDALALLGVVGAAACVLRSRDDGAHPVWSAAAGALPVLASGMKPSFAVIAGIAVLGARHRWWAVAGAAGAAAFIGAVVLLAFGGALPSVGIQGRLVTPLSLSNLAGWALGHGGADAGIRSAAHLLITAAAALATAYVLWRRERALPAMGVVLLVAALGLSWVMPWYLGWALPFAALATPRALVPLAVAGCVWLGIGGVPQLPKIVHAVGFYPTRSATGLANHDYEQRLVK
jgi:Glycosyltransferase family 87